jgi:phage replication-related protein YjqB (UPF0714/DUF867 family)
MGTFGKMTWAFVLFPLCAWIGCASMSSEKAAALGSYQSYAQLSRYEKEGVDYRIRVRDRQAETLILAIHGGGIETGTSELARAVAADDHNLYLFEGLKNSGNTSLHITSHLFDEPRAIDIANRSTYCVSIHGFSEPRRSLACIGGRNARLRRETLKALKATGLIQQESENPCEEFYGLDPDNIVNRCARDGVQVELSSRLRQRLLASQADFDKFVQALRIAVGP